MSMLRGPSKGSLADQLKNLYAHGTATGLSEGELLERFVSRRDESAFQILVERHGPMVRRVCRRLLDDPNDVEDAFQATFLVLIRRAGAVRHREMLANWLFGVACRVSKRARATAIHRRRHLLPLNANHADPTLGSTTKHPGADQTIDDQWVVWLHEEVSRLPEKYRTPVVLCYFQGFTHESAAARLACPLGTVKGRLSRARGLLQTRLVRRGVTLTAVMIEAGLASAEAGASLSYPLSCVGVVSLQTLASASVSSVASAGISASVAKLAQGVSQAMIFSQLKAAVLPFAAMGVVASGVVVGAAHGLVEQAGRGPDFIAKSKSVPAESHEELKKASGSPAPILRPATFRAEIDAIQQAFSLLVNAPNALDVDDYRRLVQWSEQLSEKYSTGHPDAAISDLWLDSHRDRLKMLSDRMARTVKIDRQKIASGPDGAQAVRRDEEARALLAGATQRFSVAAQKRATGAEASAASSKVSTTKDANAATVAKASATPAVSRSHGNRTIAKSANGSVETGGTMKGISRDDGGPTGSGQRGIGALPEFARRRIAISGLSASLSVRQTDETSRHLLEQLEQPLEMSFSKQTALADVLKYIEGATSVGADTPIPVFVDPNGLREADVTEMSTVTLALKGVPLKTSLRLILKQLGLAYCVRDGVLIISDVDGIAAELQEANAELNEKQTAKDGIGGGFGGPQRGFQ